MNILQNMVFCHEHLKLDLATKERPDRKLDRYDEICHELKTLKSLGVTHIMEVSNLGMGRDISFIERLEKETGMDVWMSTGFYKEPFLPDYFYTSTDAQLIQMMCDEINIGMQDNQERTTRRAKIIGEFGSSDAQITAAEMRLFHLCCAVHKATGLPMITHTTLATMGLEQIAIFNQHQVDLSKCVLSHIDLCKDLSMILKILDSGINIGFDTIGKENYQPDSVRLDYLEEIIKHGHIGQVMLSVDITNNSQLKSGSGTGYTYLLEDFLPKVIHRFGQDIAHTLMVKNPARIFSIPHK